MAQHAGTAILNPATRTRRTKRAVPSRHSGDDVILEALPSAFSTAPAHSRADPARLEPTHEEVQRRAYEIYLARGCVPGHHLEDWLRAERELREQRALLMSVATTHRDR